MSEVTHKVEDQTVTMQTPEDPKEDPKVEPFKAFATKEEYQTHLDHVTQERVEREKRKAETKEEDARRQAREKALEDQENFKALSEQRGEELVGLKSQTETLEAEADKWKTKAESYEEILQGQWETRKTGVPDYVLDAISERSLANRLKYLDDHADKFGSSAQNGQKAAGSRPTGRPQQVPKNETDKEARERQRQARVSAI